MAQDPEPGPALAESTVAYDQFRLDGNNYTDDGHEPSPVWAASQRLRELVERADPKPAGPDRALLATELRRQVRILGLLEEVTKLTDGSAGAKADRRLSLFVLLFPGEGRDNTGIKDLNDKVLHYKLTSEFVALRQDEIRGVFTRPGSGPGYVVVGQDYKTALIVAQGKGPKDFAADLVRLDARLRVRLLEVLKKAEDEATRAKDSKRLAEIRKLQKALKNEKYRFDILYGANSLEARGNPISVVLQLITEALKGAGMARLAVKAQQVKTRQARALGRGRGADKAPKGHDPRGREYDLSIFLRTAQAAEDIKALMTRKPNRDDPLDYNSIYVNTVWTVAFLLIRGVFIGNPDVIRDVRKKALERPPGLPNMKFTFRQQVELLEMWLVALNAIDFVKDFTAGEAFGQVMNRYLILCHVALQELENPAAPPIDWPRLAKLLTRDVRQRPEPLAILGAASEFVFYSYTSDFEDQIVFAMDIRDLGVDLMAYYEVATREIVQQKLGGFGLLRRTIESTDVIVERKRFTVDSVVATFKKYHGRLAPDAKTKAHKAFGSPVRTADTMPDFARSVRVMLGGDEVFVAAHPLYAAHVHEIIRDLDKAVFGKDIPLNMRVGVAFSSAKRAIGRGSSQRLENQIAHDRAMKLAGDAGGMLKQLERTHRRIELLIDKLERNDKKKHLAPGYRKRLDALRLRQLFARVQFMRAQRLTDATHAKLRLALKTDNLAGALGTGVFDLVDFNDAEVDAVKLAKQAEELEKAVRKDVGFDNVHVDPPPVTKIPKWIQKLIDKLLGDDEEDEEEDEGILT
ncbi:hypothetical protein [Allorhizocola rhizosphaerae]|uniref:hypothetical protein n=1 Tax=Allorhizocola rhizosphaerae TaxID=1872709 RepID=UPI000E3DB9D9|nr:hypothetical protein [Allorhizocola rhizosphaerae]